VRDIGERHRMLVGVCEITKSGHQKRDRGCRSSCLWPDEESDIVFRIPRAQSKRVHTASQALWSVKLEVDIPSSVVQIVIVEVNCGVFLGCVSEAGFFSSPVVPCHTAGWHVHSRPTESFL